MISLNLLPFRRKEIFRWRQYVKKAISNGIKIIFLLIFFAVPLGAIDFYLKEEIKTLNAKIELFEKTENMRQLNSMEKTFKEINNALIKIDKISENQIYWNRIFARISSNISFDIQIFSLQIEPNGFFAIAGNAKTREGVLEMEKKFINSTDFSDVKTPLDNLIKKEDINFKFSGNIILDNFKEKKNENIKKDSFAN